MIMVKISANKSVFLLSHTHMCYPTAVTKANLLENPRTKTENDIIKTR